MSLSMLDLRAETLEESQSQVLGFPRSAHSARNLGILLQDRLLRRIFRKRRVRSLSKAFSQPPKTGLKTAGMSAKLTSSNCLAAPPKASIPGAHPPAPANPVPPPGTLDRTGSTGSVSHDLSKGSLFVDLSSYGGCIEQPQSSLGSSSDTSHSEEDDSPDDPDDESDEFIEYFSKRYKKRAKARARGPLIL
ncbi:hypothetical protein HID58_048055 [Brassica napus]|uniref:Uncharacterized protein n=1 Tax=Brassica napus TaxID=3708 RepID=A0ABQ8B117_BRANA|nr:hypothetical protein HID58_048055 [Brassica napus]